MQDTICHHLLKSQNRFYIYGDINNFVITLSFNKIENIRLILPIPILLHQLLTAEILSFAYTGSVEAKIMKIKF